MAIVDASGDVEKGYTYDVYGEPTVTGSLGNEFDFAGQQTDPSTGLQYLRARYYDPQSGTFMSREPLTAIPESNLPSYVYALANPVRYFDPSGEVFVDGGQGGGSSKGGGRSGSGGGGGKSSTGASLTTPPVVIREYHFREHVIKRHTASGVDSAGKSIFTGRTSDIRQLVKDAAGHPRTLQRGTNNYQTVIQTDRIVGVDWVTRQPTNTYTVITDAAGNLITAFPGVP
jgi:RHS repeat-associated protein